MSDEKELQNPDPSYEDLVKGPARSIAEKPIIYRPSLKNITGSLSSAMLLGQINYWWFSMKEKPFYKFHAPCQHELYREGDSWQEELNFTRSELERAMKNIATKVSPKKADEYRRAYIKDINGKMVLAPVDRIVLYWKDINNVTWYEVNQELLSFHLIKQN